MLLNTVIILLREVLEATLLISVLLAISDYLALPTKWLKIAMIMGALGAIIFKLNILKISSSFDDVGQEITNAILQILIYILLTLIIYLLNNRHHGKDYSHYKIMYVLRRRLSHYT